MIENMKKINCLAIVYLSLMPFGPATSHLMEASRHLAKCQEQ